MSRDAGGGGLRVIFVVAAGPRIGFGHLVRSRSLARALGVPPVVVLRGSAKTRRRAGNAGWQLVNIGSDQELRRLDPQVIVVDDPQPAAVASWVRRARRAGVPVATIHDLGIAAIESDLVIDGSLQSPARMDGRFGSLRGASYAILDPRVRTTRDKVTRRVPRRVLIALGGGRHSVLAAHLADAIAARVAGVEIRVAGGFTGPRRARVLSSATWVERKDGLADELASASMAVLAGGVTLYEACALATPVVAVALNAAQHVTIRAIARRGAAVDGGRVASGSSRSSLAASGFSRKSTIARVVREVERLFREPAVRRRLALNGRRLVDGRGAMRVAARLRQLPAAVAGRIGHVA
jgi:spore coat polysaccharide biosynthesis predicted glycosyltransferase SpsG